MSQGQFNRSNQAYEKYKASLNALFDGKRRLPEHLRQMMPGAESALPETLSVIPAQTSRPAKSNRRLSGPPVFSYEIFLEAIKRSTTPDEVTRTINALIDSGHQIPQDEDILSKALIHRDESVVLSMLQKLDTLLRNKALKNSRLVKTRLENLLLIASSSESKHLAKSLLNYLE